MQDLTLVGVHDDGEHLVLAVGDDRFLVPIDEALRDAVRPSAPAEATVPGGTGSPGASDPSDSVTALHSSAGARGRLKSAADHATLRPRDIQARIRAGASPEQVAAEAGVPIELVRRYEGPVLAEREHVARLAFTAPVRRATPPGERGSRTVALGELVTERLVARGVDPEDQDWDAWRADGDHWVVEMTFAAGGRDRVARWHFHPVRGTVTATDDESRWLSEDRPVESGADQLGGPISGRRLSAVTDASGERTGKRSDRVYDVEADGGVRPADEDDAVTSRRAATLETGLLDALRARRGRRQPVVLDGGADDSDDVAGDVGAQATLEATTLDATSGVATSGDADSDGSSPEASTRPTVVPAADAEPGGTADLFGEAELWEPVPAAHPPTSRPDEAVDAEVLALPDEALPTADDTDPTDDTDQIAATTTAEVTPDTTPNSDSDAGAVTDAAAAARVDDAAKDTGDTSGDAGAEKVAARRGRDGRPGAPRPRRAGARRSRASVPSWDDIVFGAKTD